MLEEKMTEIFELIKTGAIWTLDQMPLVVRELYIWKTSVYSVMVLLGIILLIIAYSIWRKAYNRINDEASIYIDDWEDQPGSVIFTIFIGVIGIVITLTCLFNLLQITLAPRIWLVEYIAQYIS